LLLKPSAYTFILKIESELTQRYGDAGKEDSHGARSVMINIDGVAIVLQRTIGKRLSLKHMSYSTLHFN
jgi:hypothetical protein